MRKNVYLLALMAIMLNSYGQSNDPLVSNCVMNAGANAKYLKDFRIMLGESITSGEPRYKANMSLWKNTRYRFTMCNSENSKGKLILKLKDDTNKIVVSSVDQKSGKTYAYVDFVCNKSGIYQLNFDFAGGQQGSAVGVVSMIK
jgi:hypothetical protein